MCEPVSTTTMFYTALAVSAASAGMSYMGQMQNAEAQAKYQEAQAAENARYMQENAELANNAYIDKTAQENLRLVQTEEAAGQEIEQVHAERLQKVGTAMATSEAAGLSVNMLMGDYLRQEATYKNNVRRQLEMDYDQASMNMQGFRAEAQGRAASVRPYVASPVSTPSLLGTGLQIAGAGVSAYGSYATKGKDGKYRLS